MRTFTAPPTPSRTALLPSTCRSTTGKTEWLNSLEPPYHALKLNVMRYKTSGGVICNADNLVIDNDGNGIPGLYACGAIALPGQASVTACAATGYFTGETLAAL